jgi:hypothetical protein
MISEFIIVCVRGGVATRQYFILRLFGSFMFRKPNSKMGLFKIFFSFLSFCGVGALIQSFPHARKAFYH